MTLTNAYFATKDGDMSVCKAARVFGVPGSTSQDRLFGKIDLVTVKSGTPGDLSFSQEQESLLAGHLKTMAEVIYGYSCQETTTLASDYAVTQGPRDKEHPLTLFLADGLYLK